MPHVQHCGIHTRSSSTVTMWTVLVTVFRNLSIYKKIASGVLVLATVLVLNNFVALTPPTNWTYVTNLTFENSSSYPRNETSPEQWQLLSSHYDDEFFQNDTVCRYFVEDKFFTQNTLKFQRPNCEKLLTVAKPTKEFLHKWSPTSPHTTNSILAMVENCQELRKTFPSKPRSREEAEFPLAYVFVGERNADQTLRLFRMLYWPQNSFCFTYDNKSEPTYKTMMLKLAACFPESVVVNPDPLTVNWGQDSILRNAMTCMKLLNNVKRPWRYVQIVSYNDFPLKTNLEMVQILKIFDGANDCHLLETAINFLYRYRYYNTKRHNRNIIVPPSGLIMFKGSYATTMTREFVSFMLNDPVAIKLLDWMNGTWCAEEHYWPTLIHNLFLKAPGSFPGQCLWFYKDKNAVKRFVSRCQVWEKPFDGHSCQGKISRYSCVYGVDDVPWLLGRPELIAHKFYAEYQAASLYCMEQWHWKKTCQNAPTYVDNNLNFYNNLEAVRYQRAVDKDQFVC